MNKFEEAMSNVEYSTDYWEYRCNNVAVVSEYIDSEFCNMHQTWEADLSFISPEKKPKSDQTFSEYTELSIYGQTSMKMD